MCIRDRVIVARDFAEGHGRVKRQWHGEARRLPGPGQGEGCLLYTSDAADERSSVDLGGRRIIKKKKQEVSIGIVGNRYSNS